MVVWMKQSALPLVRGRSWRVEAVAVGGLHKDFFERA